MVQKGAQKRGATRKRLQKIHRGGSPSDSKFTSAKRAIVAVKERSATTKMLGPCRQLRGGRGHRGSCPTVPPPGAEPEIRDALEGIADGLHGAREELPNQVSSLVHLSPSGEQSVTLIVPVDCNPAAFFRHQILDYVEKVADENLASSKAATTPAQKDFFDGRYELASDLFTDLRSRFKAYSNPGCPQLIASCALTFSGYSKLDFEQE